NRRGLHVRSKSGDVDSLTVRTAATTVERGELPDLFSLPAAAHEFGIRNFSDRDARHGQAGGLRMVVLAESVPPSEDFSQPSGRHSGVTQRMRIQKSQEAGSALLAVLLLGAIVLL